MITSEHAIDELPILCKLGRGSKARPSLLASSSHTIPRIFLVDPPGRALYPNLSLLLIRGSRLMSCVIHSFKEAPACLSGCPPPSGVATCSRPVTGKGSLPYSIRAKLQHFTIPSENVDDMIEGQSRLGSIRIGTPHATLFPSLHFHSYSRLLSFLSKSVQVCSIVLSRPYRPRIFRVGCS